jgi:hypothetical protein
MITSEVLDKIEVMGNLIDTMTEACNTILESKKAEVMT